MNSVKQTTGLFWRASQTEQHQISGKAADFTGGRLEEPANFLRRGICANFLRRGICANFRWLGIKALFAVLIGLITLCSAFCSSEETDISIINDKGQNPLHIAVLKEDPVVLGVLLSSLKSKGKPHISAIVNKPDNSGNTPLHYLCGWKFRDYFDTRIAILETLLGLGADVNAKNRERNTPLHLVCANCEEEHSAEVMAKFMPANIGAINRIGQNPLHIAIINNKPAVLMVLLGWLKDEKYNEVRAGIINCHCWNVNGNTPLHHMCRWDFKQFHKIKLAAIDAALELGADVNARDLEGNTPLHLVCANCADEHSAEVIARLMSANIGAINRREQSPLHIAIINNKPAALMVLLGGLKDEKYGAVRAGIINCHCCNANKNTPLHYMCEWDFEQFHETKLAAIDAALELGADVNAKNGVGDTPLHLVCANCAEEHSAEVIAKLMSADIGARNSIGQNPLHIAIINNKLAALMALLDGLKTEKYTTRVGDIINCQAYMSKNTPLHCMCRWDFKQFHEIKLAAIDAALELGADVNARTMVGTIRGQLDSGFPGLSCRWDEYTPLHLVCANCAEEHSAEVIAKLMSADIGAINNRSGQNPLHIAIERENIEALTALLGGLMDEKYNAVRANIINRRDDNRKTPLHCMCRWDFSHDYERKIRSLQMFLEMGGDVNIADANVDTPLHIAVRRIGSTPERLLQEPDRTLIQQFVSHGADLTAKNSEGFTPFDQITLYRNNPEFRERLLHGLTECPVVDDVAPE